MGDEDNKKESGTRAGTAHDSRETGQQPGPDSSQDASRVGTKADSRQTEKTSKEDTSPSEPPDAMRGS